MKTSEAYIKTVQHLQEANEDLMKAEIALEERKAGFVNNSGTYAACTNDKQRAAFFVENCADEIKAVRKAEAARVKAASEKEVAEIRWKSERYDIISKIGDISDLP